MDTEFTFKNQSVDDLKPKTFAGWIATWVLGAVFFVGLPAAVTAMAPVSYLTLVRQADNVTASCRTCLLFCIPYSVQHIEQVQSVASDVQAGSMIENQNSNRNVTDRSIRSEDEGFLILKGNNSDLKVSISPASLLSTQRAIRDFLDAPNATNYSTVCVTNWKVSVMFGVPLSLLTLLYVFGIASSIVSGIIRLVRGKR